MHLLVDADPIAYRIGFASQKKDKETGLVVADPLSHTLHSCKVWVNEMLEATGCDTASFYLTGKTNYRYKVREDYKGNRKGGDKPVHLEAIRQYLEEVYGAIVVHGMEADDAVGLRQTSDTAIATIDKDLLMVEGLHYNYGKQTWTEVSAEEGERFFYQQMITGDKVDNILGIHGLGEKKAQKLLANTPREDWDEMVIDLYIKHLDFHRCVQNSMLLWILQKDKQMPMEFV
jgi:DNA polymerase-1